MSNSSMGWQKVQKLNHQYHYLNPYQATHTTVSTFILMKCYQTILSVNQKNNEHFQICCRAVVLTDYVQFRLQLHGSYL